MKTIKTLLLVLLLTGCTIEEDNKCNCTKETYERVGLSLDFHFLYSDPAICQEETNGWQGTPGSGLIFFKIVCD